MANEVTRKIVINGKAYENVEEMPPEIRAVYEKAMSMLADDDANGVPDVIEGKGPGVWTTTKTAWSIAREARAAGIRSVELPGRLPELESSAEKSVRVGSQASPGPVEIRSGSFGKLILAIGAAAVLVLALQQLGVIE